MNKLNKYLLFLIFSILVACNGLNRSPISYYYLDNLTVTPDTATIKPGDKVILTGIIKDYKDPNIISKPLPDKRIFWQLISGLGTISDSIGNSITYTAPTSVPGDTVVIALLAFPYSDMRQSNQKTVYITIVNPSHTTIVDTSICFTRDVLPILNSNCAVPGCHDGTTSREGLNMSSYATIMSGVRAGNPNSSKLYRVMSGSGEEKMPPNGRPQLTAEQKNIIYKWILEGALNNPCTDVSLATGCDTVNVTFSKTIAPIIQMNCYGCHSTSKPQGNTNLDSYAGVKASVTSGALWGALSGNSKYIQMPGNNLKISACSIKEIKIWIDAGAPNN